MPSGAPVSVNKTTAANVGFEAELWKAADALRGSMDAGEYKHVVLGLLFLKYISDAFEEQRAKLEEERAQGADPEDPDEYRAANVFWVPKEARWATLQAAAKQPTIGTTVDNAMLAIERDNRSLKDVLPKDYARPGLDKMRLGQLVDMVSNIAVGDAASRSKDVLGRDVRVLPVAVRVGRGQEGRRVLHAAVHRAPARGDARALPGPRLRPVLRLGRHVRAVRALHRGARWAHRRHLRVRPGVQLHDVAPGQDEPGDPRHRREHRARRHVPRRRATPT